METCGECGKRGDTSTIRRCSRCKAIRYCSRDCQARHWPHHKTTCTPNVNFASSSTKSESGERKEAPSKKNEQSTSTQKSKPETSVPQSTSTDPWQRARSRALAAFPGSRAVDRFDDIDQSSLQYLFPLFPLTMPKTVPVEGVTKGQAVVVRLLSPIFHPFRRGWVVEDSKGKTAHATFNTQESTAPYFRYDDLQQGYFLFVNEPYVELFDGGSVNFVRIQNVSSVRVFPS